MVLGEVEEIVTTVEIEDETLEEIIKVRDFCTFFFVCSFIQCSNLFCDLFQDFFLCVKKQSAKIKKKSH